MGAPRIDKLDKNYIINGNFDFWHRATSINLNGGPNSIGGYYSADRFRLDLSTSNARTNRTSGRSTDVPTLAESGFRSTYSFEYAHTSSLALAASDFIIQFRHKVEGIFYRNLHGKTFTLSFWFKSTISGQYPVCFQNGANNRSYVTLFTYDTANVWQKIYVTVDSDTTGTWVFDSSDAGLSIMIGQQSGATYQAPTLDSWIAGNYFAASSGVQVQSQTSITFRIAQLQLIEGSLQAGSFSMAGGDYKGELDLCKRYSQFVETASGIATGATTYHYVANFYPEMRAVPVPSVWFGLMQITDIYTADFNQSSASAGVVHSSTRGGRFSLTNFSGLTIGRFYSIEDDGPGKVLMEAEL